MPAQAHDDFPEAAFPCAAAHQDFHDRACHVGRERMAGLRIVICMLARDVAGSLPATIARIDRLGACFANYRVVVFENDSVDDTLRILRDWESANRQVTILSEVLKAPKWKPVASLERATQLAAYRNRCRDYALDRFHDHDAVLVADSDLRNWTNQGVANTFGQDGWDAVGACGLSAWQSRNIFYDVWAFRALRHPEPHTEKAPVHAMSFPRGTPLVPVLSCFGGLAFYSMAAMRAASYSGTDCEHVALHRAMHARGFTRIFMNPSLIALYPDFHLMHPNSRSTPWWEPHQP